MKALPSIAFYEFKGSAGDVTARVSKGRQVLSTRSMHSLSKAPAQAVSRNRLALMWIGGGGLITVSLLSIRRI